jgi:hypothetical protein
MAGTDTLDAVQNSLIGSSPAIGQKTDSSQDWMVYKGQMQDSAPTDGPNKTVADRAICLYETPGRPPLEAWAIDYPSVQVKVRGKRDDYTAVRNKIQQIFEQLHANETPLGGQFVYFYAIQSGPLSGGIDEKRRPYLLWNFRCMRNRPAA